MRCWLPIVMLLASPSYALSEESTHQHESPYMGQERRELKSLSAEDIKELRNGGGLGFAKAAELNGIPGPAHLLELKDQIVLDAGQVAALREIYEAMRLEAMTEGRRLIALESELETHFRNSTITDHILWRLLGEIAESQRKLRYIHLSAHLKTPVVLTKAQIDRYNALRGYEAADPCNQVPEGHNAELWRKHNNCS